MNELTPYPADFARDSPLEPLPYPVGPDGQKSIRLFLKRDDLLHPLVSGNKWRKLKYTISDAHRQGFDTLLTFGGAFSNHLYATAAAGKLLGFKTIGVIRGEELGTQPLNSTLAFCQSCGMALHFISRAEYRRKNEPDVLSQLQAQFGDVYVIPEGGTNELAIRERQKLCPKLSGNWATRPITSVAPLARAARWSA